MRLRATGAGALREALQPRGTVVGMSSPFDPTEYLGQFERRYKAPDALWA